MFMLSYSTVHCAAPSLGLVSARHGMLHGVLSVMMHDSWLGAVMIWIHTVMMHALVTPYLLMEVTMMYIHV